MLHFILYVFVFSFIVVVVVVVVLLGKVRLINLAPKSGTLDGEITLK